MRRFGYRRTLGCVMAMMLPAMTGCVSIAPIEPIKNPPIKFRADTAVMVEFMHPSMVGMKCAKRGASAHGLPVAMACADTKLMTMPDPCNTFTGGPYAKLLCGGQRSARRDEDYFSHASLVSLDPRLRPRTIHSGSAPKVNGKYLIEFVRPDDVAGRCEARGLEQEVSSDEAITGCASEGWITVSNPCMSLTTGWYARTLCHELGHVNGWPVNHLGGSYRADSKIGIDPSKVPPPNYIMDIMTSDDVPPPASQSAKFLAFKARQKAYQPPMFAVSFAERDVTSKLRGRLTEYSLLVDDFY